MKKKKLYSSEEKAMIIREHLENKVPVSELSEKYEIHPNLLYKWQKQYIRLDFIQQKSGTMSNFKVAELF